MWIGSLVHLTIEGLLKTYQAGGQVPSLDELQENLLTKMRADFVKSREGWPARKPWRLYEHEYAADVEDQQWKAIAEQGKLCLQNFWESELHQKIQSFSADQWLEIEEFSGFFYDGVKIHVVLDFSYREGEQCFIVDWKTGRKDLGMAELQLACYRLYAMEKWQVEDHQVTTVEYNLTLNQQLNHDSQEFSLEDAREKIKTSMDDMRSFLSDVPENSAEEENFPFVESESACQSCQFKKICRRWI